MILTQVQDTIIVQSYNHLTMSSQKSYASAVGKKISTDTKNSAHTAHAKDSAYIQWSPMFPSISKKTDECVIKFSLITNGMLDKLCIGSNCYYELYVNSNFYADGGMRCSPGKILRDTFVFDKPVDSRLVYVLVHYVSYNNSVWYRMLFPDPFFNDFDERNKWEAGVYKNIGFGSKISSQLMRQNIVFSSGATEKVPLNPVNSKWRYIDHSIKFKYLSKKFNQIEMTPLQFTSLKKFPPFVQKSCSSKFTSGEITNWNQFKAKEDENLMEILHNIADTNVVYYTIDLVQNCLYKLFVKSNDSACPIVVYYSEVDKFKCAWDTDNRNKVWLADIFYGNTETYSNGIEWRGCRYLHIVTAKTVKFEIMAIRKEYSFEWKQHKCKTPQLQTIYDACKNNLVACVDGGIVDTNWRERAQWVGDAYISTKILKKMTTPASSTPIIKNVLTQIADSYDPDNGMIQGAYPIKKQGKVNFLMPTYHLLWVMSVIENADIVPELLPIAQASVQFWESNYVSQTEQLVVSAPGWNFVDWAGADASGREYEGQPNCFVNVLYLHVCAYFKIKTNVTNKSIDQAFLIPDMHAYSLYKTSPASLQATGIAICFMDTSEETKRSFTEYLTAGKEDFLKAHTMYYGYYVAKALSSDKALLEKYILDKYHSCAETYSTIIEKTTPESSMAHGWSIGVADFL